jgi:hypothetical protein
MGLLMMDTMLIDRILEDAQCALDEVSQKADVTDLGCDPFDDAVDHRLDPATPAPRSVTWPHHPVTTR